MSLLLVGGTILLFAISLPLEDLAHFADIVLLLALILVNVALIVHRRRFPDIERPFRVPWVPLLPGLGILANLFLLFQIAHHPAPLAMASCCLLLGILGFFAWQGFGATEVPLPGAPSRVALERSAAGGKPSFRVLVPLANPDNVRQLIDLAATIAAERQGGIVVLRVAIVPEQLPPTREEAFVERERAILELAHSIALEFDIPVTSLVRVGHNVARAILETASERDCDLIVMGWKGHTTTAQRILGEVVDTVAIHARSDMMLVKQVGEEPLRSFLLPTAGGEHARCAEQYIASLVRGHGGSLTVCGVVPPDAADEDVKMFGKRLKEAQGRVVQNGDLHVDSKLIRHESVSVGIINEAKNYDAVVVGAAGQSIYPQILFGSIPEAVAKRYNHSVILIKHHHPLKALVGRVIADGEAM